MVSTINATSTGVATTADNSGILKVQSNGVTVTALAWVNFNGVTTASVRASYNVSSVVRNAAGDYSVNFSNALADANYCLATCAGYSSTNTPVVAQPFSTYPPSTSAVRVQTGWTNGTINDVSTVNIVVFGNS
jgi:hypothetical protein